MRPLLTTVLLLLSSVTVPLLAGSGGLTLEPAPDAPEACPDESTRTARYEYLATRMDWTAAEPLLYELLARTSAKDPALRAVLFQRLSDVTLEMGDEAREIFYGRQAREAVRAWREDPTGCVPDAFEALEATVGPPPPPDPTPRQMTYEECRALSAMAYIAIDCEPLRPRLGWRDVLGLR